MKHNEKIKAIGNMKNNINLRTKIAKLKKRSAFAIVEALISTLLFLIGFVGLLAMSTQMVQATNTAKFRAEAVEMVGEITSEILLDKGNLSAYADGGGSAARAKWDTLVLARLPNAATSLVLDGSKLVVTVRWKMDDEVDEHQYQIATFVSYNT